MTDILPDNHIRLLRCLAFGPRKLENIRPGSGGHAADWALSESTALLQLARLVDEGLVHRHNTYYSITDAGSAALAATPEQTAPVCGATQRAPLVPIQHQPIRDGGLRFLQLPSKGLQC